MFSFFKKKPPAPEVKQAPEAAAEVETGEPGATPTSAPQPAAPSAVPEAVAPVEASARQPGAPEAPARAMPEPAAPPVPQEEPAPAAADSTVGENPRAPETPPEVAAAPAQPPADAAALSAASDAQRPTHPASPTPAPSRWWTPPWKSTAAPAPAPQMPEAPPASQPAAFSDGVATPPSPVTAPAAKDVAPVQPLPARAALPIAAAPPVAPTAVSAQPPAPAPAQPRKTWIEKLKVGLRKTGTSLTTIFTGTKIDDALYEELETALLMADSGVKATEFLLADLKRRVKESKATDPAAVKGLLSDAITDLLAPLQKTLQIGDRADNLHEGKHGPTVIMVAGVNGAGKTTSIGKLTSHLAQSGATVLLAAADTFRAAAREQLAVWATRNTVEIISQQGGDPAAVSFDAVSAGRARGRDVVLVDTAGRLPTQLHLMEELKKIRRVVQKADPTAPHEVLLVIDGNTGQNALAQVRSFDDALKLTGLIITKLDGTAKGGVLCAIAREKPVPVYFIGVGEKLEDLETFNAREFAQALLS